MTSWEAGDPETVAGVCGTDLCASQDCRISRIGNGRNKGGCWCVSDFMWSSVWSYKRDKVGAEPLCFKACVIWFC